MSLTNATLCLNDGTLFHGTACGASGDIYAEIVCVTSMTGYEKILTDPSYNGQIILFTTPHVGVVGIHDKEMESSKASASGCIMRSCSFSTFHPNASETLPSFLQRHGVVAICDIDTRSIARRIQQAGRTYCRIISDQVDVQRGANHRPSFDSILSPAIIHLSYRVAVIDYGVKYSILCALIERGCDIKIFSSNVGIEDIMSFAPQAVLLSNGSKDPNEYDLSLIKNLIAQKIPLMGICLGHQLIAKALGAKTVSLPHGHRSSNHPVIEVQTNKVFITAQNHGFHVLEDTLPHTVSVSYRSLIDGSIEGLCSHLMPIITVQYHPEGAPGPCDTSFVFDRFCELIRQNHAQKR